MATPSKVFFVDYVVVTSLYDFAYVNLALQAANGVNKISETSSVKRREGKKEEKEEERKGAEKLETELRRLRQSFCFKARPLSSFYNERERLKSPLKKTPQANQKSLTPARKTPTTFSQPSSVKKSSRRLWKTSDQNPADHPLSKYAALIDSEDTHYPMYIISQPSSVKKSSRRLWKTSDQNPADPLSKYATLIDSEDTHYPNY
ncbi:hypothetical protein Tco_0558785 [Tanacetum coccineum]